MRQWLYWAIGEFCLESVAADNFAISGALLCALSKKDFLDLAPPFVGDILWEHFDMMQRGTVGAQKIIWLPFPFAFFAHV